MTGFARTNGNHDDYSWLWELKSVNGRGLEIRSRLPLGYDAVEEVGRKILKATFQRGSVNFHLQLHHQGGKADYQINTEFLNELIELSREKSGLAGVKSPRIDGLLGLKGVIEPMDKALPDEDERSALETALIKSFKEAVEKLKAARLEEGAQLAPVLTAQLDEIADLTKRAQATAALRPEAVKERITKQIDLLLGNTGNADEERIEQELAILATKADISEEVDRLASHIVTARDVLNSGAEEAVGRRLDFICQEFNRETNTICSKSNDKELTQIGLDLKVIIDRFREQVQNIE
nr:YicC/YloC family endoribonuclease [Sneathiella limimaris]